MKIRNLISILIISLFCRLTFPQPGTIDNYFNSEDIGFGNGDGPNNYVSNSAIQSDGKIIIIGQFHNYNSKWSKYIARVNPDGTFDDTFNTGSGPNDLINAISIQTDGKIIIAGYFTTYDGIGRNRIARLNADGSIDNSFNPGTGANGAIHATSIQSDSKIIIAGSFTDFNGNAINQIARLNSNGTIDNTFNPGSGVNDWINSIVIQSDGRIIICGYFSTFNGVVKNHIARLYSTGTLDTTFNTGSGANDYVLNTLIQSDGKIVLAGNFNQFNGVNKNRIARINKDGSLDSDFNLGTGANDIIYYISLENSGKIIIGGFFTYFNGTEANHITRLNSNGSLDNTFNPGTGANDKVLAISTLSDNKILLGGLFTKFNGETKWYISVLLADGTLDNSFNLNTGANKYIRTISLQSDGKIIAGGAFTLFNGKTSNYIARLNSDGKIDNSFETGTGSDDFIYTSTVQSDDKILIGGFFTSFNDIPKKYISRLNSTGSLDETFNIGTGANDYVRTIAIQSNNKIIIGGDFTSFNKTIRNRIARLNLDGSLDNTFNPGTGANEHIETIAIQSDGKILIGGYFTSYNGVSRNYLSRLNSDGTIDNTFNIGSGPNSFINTISIQSDGKILIGGTFSNYNGTAINKIARLNTDGTIDNSFNLGTGANDWVTSINVQSDSNIVVCGFFTKFNGVERNCIARLNSDGTLDNTFNPGSGANGYVLKSTIQNDGKIIIGGYFTSYDGIGRNRIARINSILTSVNETTNKVKVFPNPSSGNIIVDCNIKEGTQYELIDIKGQIIQKGILYDRQTSIDLSMILGGIYFLRIEGNNLKIIKE